MKRYLVCALIFAVFCYTFGDGMVGTTVKAMEQRTSQINDL